jgi:hypothetical protein
MTMSGDKTECDNKAQLSEDMRHPFGVPVALYRGGPFWYLIG